MCDAAQSETWNKGLLKMLRITLVAAVCTILSACATTQPPKPDAIPPELVPAGYSAADCRITEPGGAVTETGPDGRPMTVGSRQPKVECNKHTQGATVVKSTPTCKTKAGVDMPLSDCCLNDDGTTIPNCTIKSLPPGE